MLTVVRRHANLSQKNAGAALTSSSAKGREWGSFSNSASSVTAKDSSSGKRGSVIENRRHELPRRLRVERCTTGRQFADEDPKGPPIHGHPISVAPQDFRRHVLDASTKRPTPLERVLAEGREAEVGDDAVALR